MSFLLGVCLAAAPALAPRSTDDEPRRRWTIFADRIFTGTGRTVDGGMVVVNNGQISLVSVSRDDESQSETIKVHAVTAGLIDASARIYSGLESVEQSREIAPDVRVADTLDVFAIEWDRELRSGVTTVLITPPDLNVIGGLGVVLKTGGAESIAQRTIKPDAVMRGAIGRLPSENNSPIRGRPTDFTARRPTTRMGVEWEWRKAFYDAAASQHDAERAFEGSDRLIAVLKGELPLSIQAWTTQDIRTAVFLKEEIEREGLGQLRLILDAAAEAWREPELLVRSKTPVVLPPFSATGRVGETNLEDAFMAWNVAKLLTDRGITVALSSHGAERLENRLAMQAGYAMRGGMSFDEALAAVTINPARILGVDKRVGTIEVGKDADLVLWSGPPFEPSSRVVGVILDGVLAIDPRAHQ
jgi:imidazolonepropionase-like amidohydrolase